MPIVSFLLLILSLSRTDKKKKKWAETEGLAKKWLQGKYPMYLAVLRSFNANHGTLPCQHC